jgi:putative FmdB family regulatory protein
MPTYEYECVQCGHVFELFQTFGEEPVSVCPQCQGRVRRVFYPVGIIFKGTGWHITDYSRRRNPSEDGSGSEKDAKEKVSSEVSD